MLIKKSIPSGLVIPVADFKARIHFEGGPDEEKDDITRMIRAATARYETRTLRTMLPTELEWQAKGWSCIDIPVAPIRDDMEVVYLDPAEAEQTLDPGSWQFEPMQDRGGLLTFTDAFSYPDLSSRFLPVRVRFMAGYDDPAVTGSGDNPETAQNPMDVQAIMMLAAHWYLNREAATDRPITSVPAGFEDIVDERRIYR